MKAWLLAMIGFYQRRISPMLGARCRFHPTCSHYAREALQNHGLIKGMGLAIWRILRCQPFCKGGYDPVPLGKQTESEQAQADEINSGPAE
jgi:uncharacterized protein